METLIIVYYYYYDEGYNVFVTIEIFPHIDVMIAESTINSPDQDTQGPPKSEHFPKFILSLTAGL